MSTPNAILPVNPSGITNPTTLANSNYKTMSQLCDTVNQIANPTVGSDLGPSGANSRTFGTTYTAASNLFVAATGLNSAGVGTNAQILPSINGTPAGPGNSVTNGPGMAGTGFIVPSGATYSVAFTATGGSPILSLYSWFETALS